MTKPIKFYWFFSGKAFKLQLEGPLYVGGLDPSLAEPSSTKSALGRHHRPAPPVVWSAALGCGNTDVLTAKRHFDRFNRGSVRTVECPGFFDTRRIGDEMKHFDVSFSRGFVGCLRDVVVNGHTVDVAEYANVQDSGEHAQVPDI